MIVEKGADRPLAAKPNEQEVACDNRRQNQRQMNNTVPRANSQPIAMPNGSAHAVATTAMRSDSSTAVHSAGESSSIASVPIPKFACFAGTPSCELRNQRDTTKYIILVRFLDLKFLREFSTEL